MGEGRGWVTCVFSSLNGRSRFDSASTRTSSGYLVNYAYVHKDLVGPYNFGDTRRHISEFCTVCILQSRPCLYRVKFNDLCGGPGNITTVSACHPSIPPSIECIKLLSVIRQQRWWWIVLHPRSVLLHGPAALLAFPSFVYLSVRPSPSLSLLVLPLTDAATESILRYPSLTPPSLLCPSSSPSPETSGADGTVDSTAHVRQKLFNADSSERWRRLRRRHRRSSNWHGNTCAAAVADVVVVGRVD